MDLWDFGAVVFSEAVVVVALVVAIRAALATTWIYEYDYDNDYERRIHTLGLVLHFLAVADA